MAAGLQCGADGRAAGAGVGTQRQVARRARVDVGGRSRGNTLRLRRRDDRRAGEAHSAERAEAAEGRRAGIGAAAGGGAVAVTCLRERVARRVAEADAQRAGEIEGRARIEATEVVGRAGVGHRVRVADRLADAADARRAFLAVVEAGRFAQRSVPARAAEVHGSVGEARVVARRLAGVDPGAALAGAAAGLRDRIADAARRSRPRLPFPRSRPVPAAPRPAAAPRCPRSRRRCRWSPRSRRRCRWFPRSRRRRCVPALPAEPPRPPGPAFVPALPPIPVPSVSPVLPPLPRRRRYRRRHPLCRGAGGARAAAGAGAEGAVGLADLIAGAARRSDTRDRLPRDAPRDVVSVTAAARARRHDREISRESPGRKCQDRRCCMTWPC